MSLVIKILATLAGVPVILGLALAGFSAWQAARIARDHPNRGTLTDVGGIRLNSLLVKAGPAADLPPLVFIHGASGNLNDPAGAFRSALEGRADLLFVDRPGHGYSERGGPGNMTPDGQADEIVRLMTARGIERAIIIGHSFGGAITAAIAVRHPDRVAGIVFLAPATHPWPGGIEWYYDLANTPVLGPIFCHTIALPAGLMRMKGGIDSVFSPNPAPPGYMEDAQIELVLRPQSFCNNARDVANLYDYVVKAAPAYTTIAAPTVIITGDSDDIVLEEIHSRGLARDIAGSELVWVKGLGHKPDYVATDLAIAAIEKVAGKTIDLQALARNVERRIANP